MRLVIIALLFLFGCAELPTGPQQLDGTYYKQRRRHTERPSAKDTTAHDEYGDRIEG